MRHRIKKIPTLSKLTSHHLLHSDKSTKAYFYENKSKVATLFRFVFHSTNDVRWTSPHHDKISSPTETALVNRMSRLCRSLPASLKKESKLSFCSLSSAFRSSRKTTSFSGIRSQTRLSAIPLVLSSIALLLVLGFSIFPNPSMSDVYAEGTPAEECEAGNTVLALDMTGDLNLSTNVDDDISNNSISYLSKDFKVTACRTAGYKVYVQANSSKLQNQQAPDALFGVGENKAPSEFENNTWGYAIGEASSDNTTLTYNTMPEPTTSRTESYSEDLSTGAAGKNLKITFAAKFGKDKVAGHYTSDVLMSVVSNAKDTVMYSITYNGNGNTGGTAPVMQTAEGGETYTFSAANAGSLTKTNYTFLGWSENPSATSAQYQPDSTVTLTKDAPTKTLYAVWFALPTINGTVTQKFGSFTYMQEPGLKDYCTSSSTPDKTSGQLVDGRDGKIYWVTVLGTGAAKTCWMTQDLDLDLKGMTITTTNDGDNLYKGSDANWTGGDVDSKEAGWNQTNGNPTKSIEWWNRNTGSNANGAHKAEHNFLGNLYSYEAATAGTGSKVTTDNTPATGSICPAGWKLPISGSSSVNKGIGSFNSLKDTGVTSNSTANGSPYFFQYGGYINGSLYNVGDLGSYWSATSSSSSSAYRLFFSTNGSFNAASNYDRYYGFSVRCVVR